MAASTRLRLCSALLLLLVSTSLTRHASAAAPTVVVGTWIQLSVNESTAPASSGFCDHFSVVDYVGQRVLVMGGDGGGGEDTDVLGLWALDYSHSLEAPVWRSLSANLSDPASIDAPAVGEGSQGALRQHCTSHASAHGSTYATECPAGVTLTVYGGHSPTTNDFLNGTYTALVDPPRVNESASWYPTVSEDAADDSLLPAIAWGTASWGDNAQSQLFLYGGTKGDTGEDCAELWLLDLTASSPAWVNVTAYTSGDIPPKLSGCRFRYNNATGLLVLMGGYSCTTDSVSGQQGGVACFSNSVWLLNPVTYVWTGFHDPNPGPSSTWPSPRAWHSTILYGSQLWVFGGQYVDSSLTVYYLNDVVVWDLRLQAWQTMAIKGTIPPVMWSQTSNLVTSPSDGLPHMVIIGGCTSDDYYSDVYALKLNTAVLPSNCQAIGPGLINATAGADSTFFIQTRAVVNASTNGTGGTWGQVLTWGVQLQFDVLVIGELGGVPARLESQITELGNGLYQVVYTAFGGASGCGQVTEASVTVSVMLDGVSVPGAPFIVSVLPAVLDASKAIVTDVTETVQDQATTFSVHPADEYGNLALGLLSPSRLSVLVDGLPASELSITSQVTGEYDVSYRPPSTALYTLSVLFDGADVPGSPFSVVPLANLAISEGQQLGVQVTASLVSALLLLGAAMVVRARAAPVMKAASPTFTLLILAGCQLALSSCLLPAPTSLNSDCTAYAWTLSVGCTLVFSSLNAKAWRVAKIFHASHQRNRLRIVRIKDSLLVLPVVAAVGCEMVLNACWVAVNPLRATDQVSSSNPLLHYVACQSANETVWYALEFGLKGALLLYGISLASQVRKVPAAFNDSQWIAWSTYNIVGCGIAALAVVFLFSSTPSSAYLVRSFVVIWCTLVTAGLMLLPKLIAHAFHHPPPTGAQNEASTFSKAPFPTLHQRVLSNGVEAVGTGLRSTPGFGRSVTALPNDGKATRPGSPPVDLSSPHSPRPTAGEFSPAQVHLKTLALRSSNPGARVGPAPSLSSSLQSVVSTSPRALRWEPPGGALIGHSATSSMSATNQVMLNVAGATAEVTAEQPPTALPDSKAPALHVPALAVDSSSPGGASQ